MYLARFHRRSIAAATSSGAALIWDVSTVSKENSKPRTPIAVLAHSSSGGLAVTELVFACGMMESSPDGNGGSSELLVSGGADGALRMWRIPIVSQSAAIGDDEMMPLIGVYLGELQRAPDTGNRLDEESSAIMTSRSGMLSSTVGGMHSRTAARGHNAAITSLTTCYYDSDSWPRIRRSSAQQHPQGMATSMRQNLISGDAEGCIVVWRPRHAASGEIPSSWIPMHVLRLSVLRGVPILAIAPRPSSAMQQFAIAAGDSLRLVDMVTGSIVRVFPGVDFEGMMDGRTSVVWSPDGRWLAMGAGDGVLRVWHGDTAELVQGAIVRAEAGNTIRAGEMRRAAASRFPHLSATDSYDAANATIGFPAPLSSVAWSPHLDLVAVGAHGGGHAVMLCAPSTGQ